jgi:hypothetical protein
MSRHSLRFLPLIAMLLTLFATAVPAQANVDLSYFRVVQGSGAAEVAVQWATETETDTAAFIVRRGVSADFAQGADIQTVQATGQAMGGAEYEYIDSGVSAGQKYYYWLVEFTTGGERNQLGAMQEITPGATATPATTATTPPTATAPATPATTATTPPTATPQATQPPAANNPTATTAPQPLVQNTLPPTAADTPIPAATTAPINPAAATAAPVNPAITTPDSAPAAADTPVVAADPAATAAVTTERSDEQTAETLQAAAAATPAGESLSGANAAERPANETTQAEATPQTLAEAAPAQPAAPEAQLLRPTATPRPGDTSGQGDNSSSLLAFVGGGAICGAALLALVVFFVWRRQ